MLIESSAASAPESSTTPAAEVAAHAGAMAVGDRSAAPPDTYRSEGPGREVDWSPHDLVKHYIDRAGQRPLVSPERVIELSKRIEAGLLADMLLSCQKSGMDSAADPQVQGIARNYDTAETKALLVIVAQEGAAAKKELIEANLRLVVSLAARYIQSSGDLTFADLIQEGNMGLIRAVEKFDYRRGYRFSTYATPWIRQFIGRAIAGSSRMIHLPSGVTDALARMRRARSALEETATGAVTIEALAAAMEVPVATVEQLIALNRTPLDLDGLVPRRDGEVSGQTFVDLLPSTHSSPDEEVVNPPGQEVENLYRHLKELKPRQQHMLELYYGLNGQSPLTLKEIAAEYGISSPRVRAILNAAYAKLAARMTEAED